MSNHIEHVLIIGFVWPEPNSSAAGRRMLELISLFRGEGWQVTFASSAAQTEHTVNLEEYGVREVAIQINDRSFDEFVGELNPSVVLFDRFVIEEQFGWRVAEQCPSALRIVDTEDLHFLRRERQKSVNKNQPCSPEDLLGSEDAKREIASIYRSDLSLIISEAEMQLLQETFGVPADLLQYLPFLMDPITESDTRQWTSFSDRAHFITIGNFRHAPNMDAIRYLKGDIWPLIRQKVPEAELHIYGAYPTQEARQMHKPEQGFLIKGRAENAQKVVSKGRVLLAPLRFGAGLKGKLVEAMQCGTPTVTTPIGAEGLKSDTVTWGGAICDNPQAFAKAAQKLYRNEEDWREAQFRGVQIFNRKLGNSDFGSLLISKIRQLWKHRQSHRTQNFTGQMLMHHTAASSKFMSRWIEAKNRNR